MIVTSHASTIGPTGDNRRCHRVPGSQGDSNPRSLGMTPRTTLSAAATIASLRTTCPHPDSNREPHHGKTGLSRPRLPIPAMRAICLMFGNESIMIIRTASASRMRSPGDYPPPREELPPTILVIIPTVVHSRGKYSPWDSNPC